MPFLASPSPLPLLYPTSTCFHAPPIFNALSRAPSTRFHAPFNFSTRFFVPLSTRFFAPFNLLTRFFAPFSTCFFAPFNLSMRFFAPFNFSTRFFAPPSTRFHALSTFHPNHFAWQCNMNPNEYMTSTIWPTCQRMEFSVSPTVVEPIAGPILESKEQFDSSRSLSLEANLPVEITNVDKVKKGLNIPASEGVENTNDG